MLPNKFQLPKNMYEKLKRDERVTGLTPNVSSRALFFKSIETGKLFCSEDMATLETEKPNQEKSVWLGESQTATELILHNLYPKKSPDEYAKLWALHIEHGYQISITGLSS